VRIAPYIGKQAGAIPDWYGRSDVDSAYREVVFSTTPFFAERRPMERVNP
jgi:hypothetical protein